MTYKFNLRIAKEVCEKTDCEYTGKRKNGETYCKAYFPECDEYEDYKEYLEIKKIHSDLEKRLVNVKKKLRNKGIVTPLENKISKITREDQWL